MRFQTVIERFGHLPSSLPHGTRAVDPVLTGRPDALPAWIRSAPTETTRRAAALVLVFPDPDGNARLVLTERPAGVRHAGQVSFPGGKEDPGDDFPLGTALREAHEEVGLDPADPGIRSWGCLDIVDVRVSGFLLTPVLATLDHAPLLVPAPSEVAALLLPPVDVFLPDAPVTQVEQARDGYRMSYGGYPWDGRHIWGATARALAQLGAILDPGPR